MNGLPLQGSFTPLKNKRNAPSADTVAVVTLTAIADERHVIRKITCSYRGGTPTGAGLTVTIGGTTVWGVDLPLVDNERPYDIDFPFGLYDSSDAGVNSEVVVTATDPGTATSCSATLNVQYE